MNEQNNLGVPLSGVQPALSGTNASLSGLPAGLSGLAGVGGVGGVQTPALPKAALGQQGQAGGPQSSLLTRPRVMTALQRAGFGDLVNRFGGSVEQFPGRLVQAGRGLQDQGIPNPLASLPLANTPSDLEALLRALQDTPPEVLDRLRFGNLPGTMQGQGSISGSGVGAQVNTPAPMLPSPNLPPTPTQGSQQQAAQQSTSQPLASDVQSVLPQVLPLAQSALQGIGAAQGLSSQGTNASTLSGAAAPVLTAAGIAAQVLGANPDLVLGLKAGGQAASLASQVFSTKVQQALTGAGGWGPGIIAGSNLIGTTAGLGGMLARGLGGSPGLAFGLQQAGQLASGIGAIASIASAGLPAAATSAVGGAAPALGATLAPAAGGMALGGAIGGLLSIPGTVAWFIDHQNTMAERRRQANQAMAVMEDLQGHTLPNAQAGFIELAQGNLGGADAVAEALQDVLRAERHGAIGRVDIAGSGLPQLGQKILKAVAQLGPQAFDAVMDRVVARMGPQTAQTLPRLMNANFLLTGNEKGTDLSGFNNLVPQGSRWTPAPAPAAPAPAPVPIKGQAPMLPLPPTQPIPTMRK